MSKKVMEVLPTRKEMLAFVNQAIKSGVIDIENAVNYKEVYPCALAILERYCSWYEKGSLNTDTRKWVRKNANKIAKELH